jgi:protein-S-isoprenylcysteine O-methyltransferase Ste14
VGERRIKVTVFYLGIVGLLVYGMGIVFIGLWLRRYPSKMNAEKASRSIQFLFFAGLGIPFLTSIFSPGLNHLDAMVGMAPLPLKGFFFIMGYVLLIPGAYFFGISIYSLYSVGSGARVFRLTERIVDKNVFRFTRNPMSLGYYILAACSGFISGSSLLTIFVLFGFIPAHLFFLKFFEEYELELRFGEVYLQYKQRVPFLIPKISEDY